jgi:hypothetical protein
MDKLFSCARAIQEAAPGLTPDDVEEVLSSLIRRENGMANRKGDLLRWREAAKAKSLEEIERAAVEKMQRQTNLIRREQRRAILDARTGWKAKAEAINDMLRVSQKVRGARVALSTEALQREAQDAFRGAFLADLGRIEGGLAVLRKLDPDTERDLAREVARLNGALGVQPATDARTKAIALTIAKHTERLRQELNANGTYISRETGHVMRIAHDDMKIAAAKFDGWYAAIAPKLDLDKTLDGASLPVTPEMKAADPSLADAKRIDVDPTNAAQVEAWFKMIWGNLVSGNHRVTLPTQDVDPLAGFKGPGNLARRLSEDRVLIWKGPDEALDYNRQFGQLNLIASTISGLDHGARSLGLLKVWGTNPKAALDADIARISQELRDGGDPSGSAAFSEEMKRQIGGVQGVYRVVSGEADIPGNVKAARIMGAVHMLESVARLGLQVFSNLPDLAVSAGRLRHDGVSYWGHIGRATTELFAGTPQGVRGEVARHLNAGLNGLLGGLYHRMGYGEQVPGALARAADTFFKLNLQNWWQDGQERAIAFSLSSHLGTNLSRQWGALEPGLRMGLERFGLREDHWNLARQATLLDDGATRYFTPDLVEAIQGADAKLAREAREKFGAFFATTLDDALTKPGAFERSILTGGGLAPGTTMGEAARLFAKFKQYPLTIITRHWNVALDRGATVPEKVANLGGLIAATWILGYVSMTLRELAKGRNPRSPEDAGDWVKLAGAAFVQGGGAGIYGDFLLGEYNRNGNTFLGTLAGPTFGSVETTMKLLATAIRGGRDAATGEAVQGNLPGQAVNFAFREVLPRAAAFVPGGPALNTFYGKLALDHLVIHQLQEAVNPGYLRRMQQRIERENNQTFWLPPG